METGRRAKDVNQAGSTPMCGGWASGQISQFWGPHPKEWGAPALHPFSPDQDFGAEKRSPHKIWLKISGDSDRLYETEGSWKRRCLFKGPAHRFTRSQALTWALGRGKESWEAPETYRERLSSVASGWRLEGKPPFPLCWALLLCILQASTIRPVLSPPPNRQIWIWIGLDNFTWSTWWQFQIVNGQQAPPCALSRRSLL